MRICLVVHGFPPYELAGVEAYTAGLARALVRAGHAVDVFSLRSDPLLPDLALRREARDGYRIHWLNGLAQPRSAEEALDPPGRRAAFERYLDRERPQAVHFQHVIKLGLGLIEAALERGLPSLFTAHDYFAVCHRHTLLKPDLARCATIGDPAKCATCDLGAALLNGYPELGDYHVGVHPEQLHPDAQARLAGVLQGPSGDQHFSAEAWQQAIRQRADLDQRRRTVFGRLPRILAPTAFMRERLIEGGLDPARIEHLPYGIDCAHLTGLAAPAPKGRALRIGYIGSATKHKGVLTLLGAVGLLRQDARLQGRFELTLHCGSTDRVYVQQLEQLAGQVGARWAGPYQPERLAEVLTELDLLVVPSIWVENQPLVIREAFAAHRPVVTSRLGALPESVRDGVDGLLFEPGDAGDLARVLSRLLLEPELYGRLQANLPAIKNSDTQAQELLAIYRSLGADSSPDVAPAWSLELPHLTELAKSEQDLRAQPLQALFAHVLGGLEAWGRQLGVVPVSTAALLHDALSPGSQAEILLGDQRAELDYLRATLQHKDREIAVRVEESAYLRRELDNARAEIASQNAYARGLEEEKRRERAWLDGQIENLTRERDWLRDMRAQLEAAQASSQAELASSQAALASSQAALANSQAALANQAAELQLRRGQEQQHVEALARLEGHLAELTQYLAHRHQGFAVQSEPTDRLSLGLSAAETRARQVAAAIRSADARSGSILERIHVALGSPRSLEWEAARGAAAQGDSMLQRIEGIDLGLEQLQLELLWRRREMEAMAAEVGAGLRAWLRLGSSAPVQRSRTWRAADQANGAAPAVVPPAGGAGANGPAGGAP